MRDSHNDYYYLPTALTRGTNDDFLFPCHPTTLSQQLRGNLIFAEQTKRALVTSSRYELFK